jgi:hypothetical protein
VLVYQEQVKNRSTALKRECDIKSMTRDEKLTHQQLKSGGYFLLATFAPTSPKQCSELDVVQYDSEKIIQLLGVDFKII